MTQKDFERLAAALKDGRKELDDERFDQHIGFAIAADVIAIALKADNKRFDAEKFADAIFRDS